MIQIIYSSIGGNTQLVALKVLEVLQSQKIEATLTHFQDLDLEKFTPSKLTILAAPTYNQGTLDKSFDKFMLGFGQKFMAGNNFAIIGLGDTKYYSEYLTEAATILEGLVTKNQGKIALNALRINGLSVKFLDSLVARWAQKVADWYIAS
jgi:flavodoxin